MKGMPLSWQFGGIFALAMKIRSEEPSVRLDFFAAIAIPGSI